MLTTGGGWQDQVNGLLPGAKVGVSAAAEKLSVNYELLALSDAFVDTLQSHMLLVYTGKVRLAKNLLQVREFHEWLRKFASQIQFQNCCVQHRMFKTL